MNKDKNKKLEKLLKDNHNGHALFCPQFKDG